MLSPNPAPTPLLPFPGLLSTVQISGVHTDPGSSRSWALTLHSRSAYPRGSSFRSPTLEGCSRDWRKACTQGAWHSACYNVSAHEALVWVPSPTWASKVLGWTKPKAPRLGVGRPPGPGGAGRPEGRTLREARRPLTTDGPESPGAARRRSPSSHLPGSAAASTPPKSAPDRTFPEPYCQRPVRGPPWLQWNTPLATGSGVSAGRRRHVECGGRRWRGAGCASRGGAGSVGNAPLANKYVLRTPLFSWKEKNH